jgi:hypothetical protein
MATKDPQEDPSLSGLLRPLGEKKVQSIRKIVRWSLGIIIFIVVIVVLFFVIASQFIK